MPAEVLRQARCEVLADLVDVLLYEDWNGFATRGQVTCEAPDGSALTGGAALGDGERYFRILLDRDEILLFRVRPSWCRQPYRLSRPPVVIVSRDRAAPPAVLSPRELLRAATEAGDTDTPSPQVEKRLAELDLAVDGAAMALAAAPQLERAGSGRGPGPLRWEGVAALRDRPFHPLARAKPGWTVADQERYGPWRRRPFGVAWVAIPLDRLEWAGGARAEPASAVLDAGDRGRLSQLVERHCPRPAEYLPMPVHPWQMQHALPRIFASELTDGACVPLSDGLGRFHATSSLRTLAPDLSIRVELKLSLAVPLLGDLRLLPPHFLRNGTKGGSLLRRLCASSDMLRERLHVCAEDEWWSYRAPGEDATMGRASHLACLLRIYPRLVKRRNVELVPMAALAAVTPGPAAPAFEHVLGLRREPPDCPAAAMAFFRELCAVLSETALLCFAHGVMPEIHGQNVLVVLEAGRVDGIVLRDHDTVRVHPPWLAAAGLADPEYVLPRGSTSLLVSTPEALLAYFQTLGVQVNLWSIADALARRYGLLESTLLKAIQSAIEDTINSAPLTPVVRQLLESRLLHSKTWPTRLVLRPLLAASTSTPGMPAGEGEMANPLLRRGEPRRSRS
ncbi:MAG: hypothetical protein MSC31_19460 [Solirubrobacteraceae bacterium MAG38_C4-C5]|nr:hypothetical protein [Candidatus Siliceabacter maunaloa]